MDSSDLADNGESELMLSSSPSTVATVFNRTINTFSGSESLYDEHGDTHDNTANDVISPLEQVIY